MKHRRIISPGHSVRAYLLTITLATSLILPCGCTMPGPPDGESVSDDSPVSGIIPVTIHINDKVSTRQEESIRTRYPGWELIGRLDAFVFDADGGMGLESYCRLNYAHPGNLSLPSGTGEKIIAMIANHEFTDSEIEHIYCMDDLEKLCCELTDEDVSMPVMSGTVTYMIGNGGRCDITLSPVMSVIELRSLRCKMADGTCEPALEDVKVYLTGVNNRCGFLETKVFAPTDILNGGGISESDMRKMKSPSCLYSYRGNGKKMPDGSTEYGPVSLYCYPDEVEYESIGSPFTRVVVEGKSGSMDCHYEFAINRDDGNGTQDGSGISRNCKYVYEIMLTRQSQ